MGIFQVWEAGLHILSCVWLRLFKLLQLDCQRMDLELALQAEAHSHHTSETAVVLLQAVQGVAENSETLEHHQVVNEYLTVTGDFDLPVLTTRLSYNSWLT